MAASLLENGEDPNASTTKTRTSAKNQAESELFKSALFQQARPILTRAATETRPNAGERDSPRGN
jgi:hypothetical protein